ncbi:hypothetical protein GGF46_004468 [Coemansia sp. RSA 552]|nr:hypothetical protein GGF46_004468 [Coemansia sp. RSA 552]
MIVGVGVDILSAARIDAIVRRGHMYTARFARRILSASEQAQFQAEIAQADAPAQARYLATRWCLKEAVYKAAYARQVLRWGDVCVSKDGPRPVVQIKWAPALSRACAHVSLSHDQGLVIGYAVIEA